MQYASLLLSALLLLQAAPARRAAGVHLRRGDQSMSSNKVADALASYDRAIEADPGWAHAYVRRGMARRAKGDLNGSIEDYEKARSLDPRSTADNAAVAESYSNRGLNKFFRLEIGPAVADFDMAIEHYSKEPDHFFRRGRARLIDEDFERAVADFNRAEAMNNRGNTFLSSLILVHRGFALQRLGRQSEAERDFEKSKRLAGNEQEQYQFELNLMTIEAQIKERRRRRADSLKGVT